MVENEPGNGTVSVLRYGLAFMSRLCRTQWIVIPSLLFLLLECAFRYWGSSGPIFWDIVEQSVRSGPVHFLFIGSSRVAASIDEKIFEEEMSKHLAHSVRATNVGTGYSYLLQHYLGLRNMLRRYPEHLRGCVVFVEAAGGLPEYSTVDGKDWYFDGRPGLLTQVLRLEDLPKMWVSAMSFDDKWYLSFRWLSRGSVLLTRGNGFARRTLDKATEKLAVEIAAASPGTLAESQRAHDLTTAGGIRIDQAGVMLARRLALEEAHSELSDQRLLGGWSETVLEQIVFLVRQAGGQVVFYEMPLHSVQASPRRTVIRMGDVQSFRAQAVVWGTPFLTPNFSATDDDFPDFWHLKRSRAQEFTVALARAWIGFLSK